MALDAEDTALALIDPADAAAPPTVIVLMTRAEAAECVQRIKATAGAVRVLVRELYHRQGWRALGYSDWLSCVRAELDGKSVSHAYRIRDAVEIQQQVQPDGPEVPENVLRRLKPVPPLARKTVYDRAKEDSGKAQPTAGDVDATIAEVYGALGEQPPLPPDPEPTTAPTLREQIVSETAAASTMGEKQRQDRTEGRLDARRTRVVNHLAIAEKGCVALQEEAAELACRLALCLLRGSKKTPGVWAELYVMLGPPPADSIPATGDEE